MNNAQVKPVSASRVAFQFPFALDEKALTTADNDDLILEGLAANFSGIDREGENFAPGAFARGIKAFLSGAGTLAFHHHHDQVLGRVLDMREVEEGLWVRAKVDGAIKDHPTLGTIYQQIKNETLRSLSLGGFFRRAATRVGTRITDVDIVELSVTGTPVLANGTSFSVVAGKALASPFEEKSVAEIQRDQWRELNLEVGVAAADLTIALLEAQRR